MLYSIKKIVSIVKGEIIIVGDENICHDKDSISTISIDTRTVAKTRDTMFIALKSDSDDGHNYISEAVNKGVKLFIVDNSYKVDNWLRTEIKVKTEIKTEVSLKKNLKTNSKKALVFIVVEDTLKALQQIALNHRREFKSPVIAITGSNGKTTIKEWLYELIGDQLLVSRSPRSFNSQIGVPLSLLQIESSSKLAIIEAGISEMDEMEVLNHTIEPDIILIGHIGSAHIENFRSQEQLIEEKAKLISKADTVIYCSDIPLLKWEIENKYSNTKQITWSQQNSDATLYVKRIAKGQGYTDIIAMWRDIEEVEITIPLTDRASIENAIYSLTALLHLDLLNTKSRERFYSLSSLSMRMEIKSGANGCTILNDSYSCDIGSLTVALDYLEQHSSNADRKETVVISDIEQTSKKGQELYEWLATELKRRDISRVIGVGSEISKYAELFSSFKESGFFLSTDELLRNLKNEHFKDETILIKGARQYSLEKLSERLQEKSHQTVMEIDLDAMAYNLRNFRSIIPQECKVMVMVKAFSYGTGSVEVAEMLQHHNVDYLAVAIADEGVALRQHGITTPIVVMNPESHSFDTIIQHKLEPNIFSIDQLQEFNRSLKRKAEHHYPIHLKVETGMMRLGFGNREELLEALSYISNNRNGIKVSSIFSHLAASDNVEEDNFTHEQAERLISYHKLAEMALGYPIMKHLLNSSGIERFPELSFDMVRLGIGLYGVSSTDEDSLEVVASLKSTVSQIKRVEVGDSIGYGRAHVAKEPMTIGVIPIGYADGLNRKLSNGVGEVAIRGVRVPIVGNICMDMAMVDITSMANIEVGDRVEIFGSQIKVEEIALKLDTISYEILTSVGVRVKRVYFSS